MNRSALKNFHADIAVLLQNLLQQEAVVTCQNTMIKIVVSDEIFEQWPGVTLHRIQQAIDEQFPVRTTDVTICVPDPGSRFEHVFRIWRTTLT